MTWAKLDDNFHDDPRLLGLDRSTRLLWPEGLSWCCRHLTDGAIPRAALTRLTDHEDPTTAVKHLVGAGLWEETDSGWQIVGFLQSQTSKEQAEEGREAAKFRAERSRLHKAGVHSLCLENGRVCKDGQQPNEQAALEAYSARAYARAVAGAPPTPTRPSPIPREERGREEERAGARAPKGSRVPARAGKNGFTFTVAEPEAFHAVCPHGWQSPTPCPKCLIDVRIAEGR